MATGQRAFVRQHASELAARVAGGRVVEGHGDLRPEHVWLGEPLAVIDCLEFDMELRLQDAADEVGFLALECERAHAPGLGQVLLAAYKAGSGDAVTAELVHFYQSCKACARARLAIAHLREPRYRDSSRWRRRALRYLVLAQRHLRAAGITLPAVR
jgi:aminoglycoside phosphotransferase family enzyme